MKLIIKLGIILITLSFLLTSCVSMAAKVLKPEDNEKLLYLVAGFDESAENTDVLFTLGYDRIQKNVFVAQIPRDTYYNFGGVQNKINQLYASLRAAGNDKFSSLKTTSQEFSRLLGCEFDGFVGISTDVLKRVVDSLGGVDIYLNSDMKLYFDEGEPLILKKGKNHINGDVAELFVRFRKDYVMGDLGRIDAQKMFLNALFSRISEGVSLPELISLANSLAADVVTDLNLAEIAAFIIANINKNSNSKSFFVTLPGEPIQNANGLSYYVLNKKSAAEICKKYLFSKNKFDPDGKCLNENDAGFANIYEDDSIKANEYSSDNVADMNILKS